MDRSTAQPAQRARFSSLGPVLSLSAPVVVTEVGFVTMGLVDALVVGRMGPEAIGAVGLGNVLVFVISVFGMGLFLGLDTVVTRAFGAGLPDECHRWLVHGLVLAFIAAAPLMLVLKALIELLPVFGIEPVVLALVIPYMEISAWSMPAILLFVAFRRYLLAMNVVWPIAAVVVAGNVLNALLAMAFVHGWGPVPALGTAGSAWATLASRVALMFSIAAVAIFQAHTCTLPVVGIPLSLDAAKVWRLVTLGVPAALQMTLEVGVFALSTALASMLGVASLTAHQVVLQVTTVTFIVTLAFGASSGVLVGQSLGAQDSGRARNIGWSALGACITFMGAAALTFAFFGSTIVAAFSADAEVGQVGTRLFVIAAAFQLFDGLQAVATGLLRGLGDTRTPMFTNLAGHWLVGLPLGYVLCFNFGLGIIGLWVGLSVGLVVVGTLLLGTWIHRSRSLETRFGPVVRTTV